MVIGPQNADCVCSGWGGGGGVVYFLAQKLRGHAMTRLDHADWVLDELAQG